MCGILGTINKTFNQDTLNLIGHRGPDASGIEQFNFENNKIILAQTRLAIVDLSDAGAQPMISACGNYAITFNGEIYNHLDLRKKLQEINFKGHSDTETILYYLIKFGIEGVKDFNGIFAFSFLDIKNKKQYIVRDHFGVKPVYYYFNDNELIFASEIRPIKQLIDTELNKDNLATLLRLRYIPSPNTLYNNIKKIKPGHFLEINLSEKEIIVTEKSFVQKLPKTISLSTHETLTQYGTYLEQAVKRQLMSDVEVGILLSGGIDSAVVAAIAQKHSAKPLKAFTIGFEGLYNEDEIAEAKETADLLGLEHFTKKISFKNFLDIFKETTRIIEEPLATTSVIPMYYLAQLASEQVKVVLTGQGADEPLGGYQRYQGEIISEKIPRSLIKTGGKIINKFGVKSEKFIRAANSLGEKDDVKRFLNVYSVFTQPEIQTLLNIKETQAENQIAYFYNLLNCRSKKHSVERMMAIDTRMNLADDLLLYTDKITMNFALECRVPMLDTELVKYIESLPYSERVLRGKTKIIHKEYAKKILPEQIINRPKKGFQSPTQTWFKQYNSEIKELLLSSELFVEVFNKEAVNKILNQHLQGYNREKQIFLLLSIYYWLSL